MERLTSKETRQKITDRLRPYQFSADVTITQKQFFDMYDKLLSFEDFLEKHNVETLSDYTKQVRKGVCWEIWKEFEQRLMGKKDDMSVMKVANMINSVLGQIGEEE